MKKEGGLRISNCFKDKEEELSFFRELRKDQLVHLPSDDFEPNGHYCIKGKTGLELFGKNECNWLKTPPATPLFPSLEMETTGQIQREPTITRFAGNRGASDLILKPKPKPKQNKEQVKKPIASNMEPSPNRARPLVDVNSRAASARLLVDANSRAASARPLVDVNSRAASARPLVDANRPASASRGRPLYRGGSSTEVNSKTRRQSSSPSMHGQRHHIKGTVTTGGQQVLGSPMLDKFMHARCQSKNEINVKMTNQRTLIHGSQKGDRKASTKGSSPFTSSSSNQRRAVAYQQKTARPQLLQLNLQSKPRSLNLTV